MGRGCCKNELPCQSLNPLSKWGKAHFLLIYLNNDNNAVCFLTSVLNCRILLRINVQKLRRIGDIRTSVLLEKKMQMV